MAKARNPDRIKAEEIYLEHKGNIELVKIAEIIGRPPGTVRGWKSKDKWDEKLNGTFQEKKRERSKKKEQSKNKAAKKENKGHKKIIKEVVANVELTDKQQLFCIYYLKYFNATKAYQKSYKCDYVTANASGPRMLVNVSIKRQIEKLKKERMEGVYLDGKDILQRYIDIAFMDMTDFIEFGVEDVPLIDNYTGKQSIDKEGSPMFYQVNYVNFKDSQEVDGTIISEVSKGKDGVKIKLQDKMKALDFLAKNVSLLDSMDKAKLETEKARAKKLEIDIEKIENKDNDKPIAIRLVPKGDSNGTN